MRLSSANSCRATANYTARSAMSRKTPRFSRRLLKIAKNPSTALSREADVGVKWKEPMGAPDALDRRNADAGCLSHCRACPMRGLGQRRLHGQRHDALGDSGVEFRDARGPRLVTQQPFKALRREAFLPAPDAGLGLARLSHDSIRAEPFSAQQNDPRSPSMLLERVTIADQGTEPIKVGRRDGKGDAGSHRPDSHPANRAGIPKGIQLSELIH